MYDLILKNNPVIKTPLSIPSLQMMKVRLEKVKCLAQSQWQNWDSDCRQSGFRICSEHKNRTRAAATTHTLTANLWRMPKNHTAVFKNGQYRKNHAFVPPLCV